MLIMCLAQASPADATNRKPEKKKKQKEKKEKEAAKETGWSSIKTSSLFKHNPDIPEFHRCAASLLIG